MGVELIVLIEHGYGKRMLEGCWSFIEEELVRDVPGTASEVDLGTEEKLHFVRNELRFLPNGLQEVDSNRDI